MNISLTKAGHIPALQNLVDAPVLHWHGDTFDLPRDAVSLASTDVKQHQAFSYGKHALALQFHPEVDATRIQAWLIGHAGELSPVGVSVSALRVTSASAGAKAAHAGGAIMQMWLQGLSGIATKERDV